MSVPAALDKSICLSMPEPGSSSRLVALKSGLDALWMEYGRLCSNCVVFLSFTDMRYRARVVCAKGAGPDEVWPVLLAQLEALAVNMTPELQLKLDLVTERYDFTWSRLKAALVATKRNYFRFGVALDASFEQAFLEQELNANAMLYGGREVESACLNEVNFRRYAREKYGADTALKFDDEQELQAFVTEGFYMPDAESLWRIGGKGLTCGHRAIGEIDIAMIDEVIKSASVYLTRQLRPEGRFCYGWYPCFDRPVHGYNSLRHASTTYAMAEVYEVFPDESLLGSIRQSLQYLVTWCVREYRLNNEEAAYLVDEGQEIKLGGNAVLLLAMTKYSELTRDSTYEPLMAKLAVGITSFQRCSSGRFMHVFNYPTLTLKQDFRIIYYDGEATFALARYYQFSRELRWKHAIERAFNWFERKRYGNYHDHWIAYACDVMHEITGEKRYFDMAVNNVVGYLDFVAHRITAFPTLLELMVATERLLIRREEHHKDAFYRVNKDAFYQAMELRAGRLLDGYFWPELAMYFKAPQKIEGTFFIRHHSFRIRIDDVEHFLSALLGYRRFLLQRSTGL